MDRQAFDLGCCGDVGKCSGVRDESYTARRDVIDDRGRVRSACRGGLITLMEDNEGAKATTENPLGSGRSKYIDVRWHFIRELVEKKELKLVHVASEWQHADILTKALHVKLFKWHRKALLNLPAVE